MTATPSPATQPKKGRADHLEALRRQEQAGTHVMAARNARRKGEKERALAELKQAFAAHPGDETAIELLGDIYLEDGETEKAFGLYRRALEVHPGHPKFEEMLAICKLDLEEMEADRLAANLNISLEPIGKFEDRDPVKALTLSAFLPGAGQFYNEDNEKGAAFLALTLLSCLGWFYPIWTALAALPRSQRLNVGAALASLSSFWTLLFWLCLALWLLTYIASLADAALSASRHNQRLRRERGLET